ncbi:hypothetical protein LJB42_004616 [Komagataella kurtzmanii]|nr:hypothetical protein LJB42_004616 [Komagataella kurtzmanii]
MGAPLLALTIYYLILPLISFFAVRHLNLLDAPVNTPIKIAQKQDNTSLVELTYTDTRNLEIRQPYQEIMEQLTFDSGFINCAGLIMFIAVLGVFFYYVSLLMLGGISDLYKGLNEQQKFRTADLNPVNGSSIYQEQTFELGDHDVEVDKDPAVQERTKTDTSIRTTATETTPTPKSENGSLNTSTDSLEKVLQSINTLDDDNDDDEGNDIPSKGLKPEFWGRNSMLQKYAERNPYTPRQSLSPVRSVSPKKDKAEFNEVSLKINQLANITRNSVCHSPGTSFASSVLSTTTAFPQTTATHINDDSASILEDIVLQQ